MEYSIIIPYHSNETYLQLCLNTLVKTIPESVEIIVVVNNNQGSPPSYLEDKRFRALISPQSLGYSKAINFGAEAALGKYLIFSDADTVYLDADWFDNLTAFYHSDDQIGIASSKLIDPDSNRIIDFGMGLSRYNNIHPFKDRPVDFKPALSARQVQMACSANLIIERELFSDLGKLDTDLVNFYQDNDLCLRVKEIGKECWVVANSVVYHRGGSASINRSPYRADIKGYYAAKNFHRMTIDGEVYFDINFQSLEAALRKKVSLGKYLLIDLSTVADGDWFQQVISKYLAIYLTYEFKYSERDVRHIPLLDVLGINIIQTTVPVIYFVDRYIALKANALWMRLRDCAADLVIDRNMNIVPFCEIDHA
ncbi:glycosyltransferase family 2 protein [Mucilaginibacter gotjawali]|uniref:GT2 family glycosyltransferase n=2 Tax=Mucilaginibacter gotjawali TaxID=1550579 RepID=A0A839SCJ8_9SPHI|nr:glycosyltransferase [Mucilaginibacter gotjawali]MBB3054297.1 GT2 family glycosyltransferase [Mucilaginibacter gotjawali]BAU51868.1 putative glycosyltransferase EpsH [Mucilaginibacter gotjawali]